MAVTKKVTLKNEVRVAEALERLATTLERILEIIEDEVEADEQ